MNPPRVTGIRPSTALVTGANRRDGLGLAIVEELLSRGATRVVGTHRKTSDASYIRQIAAANERLRVHDLDVTNPASVERIGRYCRTHLPSIDLLVNNAGIGSPREQIDRADVANLELQLETHAIGMVRVVQELLPLMGAGSVIANISSSLGSMDAIDCQHTFYAPAKALQNALSLQLAACLRDRQIIVTAIHPGWLRTSIGGPAAPLTARDSASRIVELVSSATSSMSGRFLDYAGSSISW